MTEYETIDALNSTMSQAWSVSQYGLTIITGYLLIAYFMGRELSKFQAGFVTLVFVVMHSLTLVSLDGISRRIQLLYLQLHEMDSKLAVTSFIALDPTSEPLPWPVYLAGLLMGLGCLYFMWTVRHARTK